ncbi:sugar ABC transporter ATP-binding protein [Ornithinimicrobium cavernae]|uniref:sugar ABC transporter ATP-binding protein n=1 Tax=Ornithinimicrobium cavernae TaxID=2666047 RepID=UPI000D691C68|nr:sugar ABC transporter ATP-binding protein [Ornithinimicrobium cavernae]
MTVGVALQGIVKSYAGTQVLHGVSVSFTPGRVYGLVGENGAGKSTLMKILTGVERPTAGSVVIDGEPVVLRNPADALARQISIISQELTTVPARTVLDNVFLGDWSSRGGFLRGAEDRRRYEDLCERVGFRLDPDRVVGALSIAAQQQVEILRAVSRGSRLLVMDEPTAVLTDTETKALLALVRRLADQGVIVVLVSHFLEEILGVADEITVLRDGRHILTGPAAEQTAESLVTAMAGRAVDVMFPPLPEVAADAPVVLEARGLVRSTAVRNVDLTVRRGEIVGLAGLVGSGRSEVARLIFGADRMERGEVLVNGRPVGVRSPADGMRAGIAMVPESRKDQGLHLNQSIASNVTLPSMRRLARWGLRRGRAERALAADAVRRLNVRGANLLGPVWTLSGGNQQKVLFAKWVARRPQLLIVDEPTRGVDVGAKAEIHRLLAELAADGMAVLLISSEIDEVINMAHRVVVLRQGRVTAEVDAPEATPERVLSAAFAEREDLS